MSLKLKHLICIKFVFIAFGFLLYVYVHINILFMLQRLLLSCLSKLMRYDLVFQLIRGFQGFVEHNKEDLRRVSSRVVRLKT